MALYCLLAGCILLIAGFPYLIWWGAIKPRRQRHAQLRAWRRATIYYGPDDATPRR